MGSVTKNKWLKYLFLKRYPPLAPYLPETRKMSPHSFWTLLGKYRHVIVKPVWGSRGRGVIQVSDLGNDNYAIHYERMETVKQGRENTYRYIKRIIRSAAYMVQQRITRPTINNRPFDMRVIVQRKKHSSKWVVTGKVIKVAGKGYVVSNNTRSHGQLLRFKPGIQQSSIGHLPISALEYQIDKVSLRSAKRLNALFPGHRIYGLDIATDPYGRVSIIEANLYPAMSHFLKLKDGAMYRRILSYKRSKYYYYR
ncbi:YheC/YheD family protein [Paenibacillus sp. Y412MC10]|uniref:YheC/YheD family protein n=1 Tax=Geobacillus sp. (strain Y412MC10) TaxID=481743 RepID=UPI0011A5E78B|nr:YheC/YheD family protein [Paenibacillus sp. Y412MC10]